MPGDIITIIIIIIITIIKSSTEYKMLQELLTIKHLEYEHED